MEEHKSLAWEKVDSFVSTLFLITTKCFDRDISLCVADQSERVAEVCQAEGKLQFTPRLYTADRWSSLLLVENYTQLQPYHTRTLMFSSTTVFAEHAGERSCDWVSYL